MVLDSSQVATQSTHEGITFMENLMGVDAIPEICTPLSINMQLSKLLAMTTAINQSECQILRSSGEWSMGLHQKSEKSVQLAYIDLITKAQHLVYIENQFFVSSTAGEQVDNRIAQALVDRIIIAAEKHERFLVVIVLPLLPGFEGEIDDDKANLMRIQLGWHQATIWKSHTSIYSQ